MKKPEIPRAYGYRWLFAVVMIASFALSLGCGSDSASGGGAEPDAGHHEPDAVGEPDAIGGASLGIEASPGHGTMVSPGFTLSGGTKQPVKKARSQSSGFSLEGHTATVSAPTDP